MKKSSAKPKITLEQIQQLIPAANDEEFEALREDIKKNGQLLPIIMDGQTIIDGRARMKICEEQGIKAKVLDVSKMQNAANDPAMLALSLNLNRRQLSVAQRALIAAKLAQLQQGANQHTKGDAVSRQEASKLMGVSEDSIDRISKVLQSGNEHLVKLTKDGELSITQASRLADMHPDIAKLSMSDLKGIAGSGLDKLKRDIYKTGVLDAKRADAMKLGEKNEKALTALTGSYAVIYADPPWDYGGSTKDSFCDPSVYYPLMPLHEIKALPVKNCLTKDAALFLWVPNCLIPSGLDVLAAWGFDFVTTMVWCKDNVLNSGGATRAAHETLLIGKKGNALHDSKKARKSWYREAITVHSKKPEYFAEMLDELYPGVPKLEMFARKPRSDCWSVYGNEVVSDSGVSDKEQSQSAKAVKKRTMVGQLPKQNTKPAPKSVPNTSSVKPKPVKLTTVPKAKPGVVRLKVANRRRAA